MLPFLHDSLYWWLWFAQDIQAIMNDKRAEVLVDVCTRQRPRNGDLLRRQVVSGNPGLSQQICRILLTFSANWNGTPRLMKAWFGTWNGTREWLANGFTRGVFWRPQKWDEKARGLVALSSRARDVLLDPVSGLSQRPPADNYSSHPQGHCRPEGLSKLWTN